MIEFFIRNRMNKILVVILVSCFFIVSEGWAQDKSYAGEVISYYGGAYAIKKNHSRLLFKGSTLNNGDRIITGENSRVKIEMSDGAIFVFGNNTNFLIEQYQYDSATGIGSGLLFITRGFFRSISGKLAKIRSNHFKVRTTMATIGVKGTEFWGGFWDGGKFEVALLSGKGVIISNQAGEVEISNIGWGTTLVDNRTAPTPPKLWGEGKIKRATATVAELQ